MDPYWHSTRRTQKRGRLYAPLFSPVKNTVHAHRSTPMSLLPDSATFHERVQDCFVAYRGRGVSLSPTDLDLLDVWAATEVPFDVVARGIRKAAEYALWDAPNGEPSLRFLSWCKRAVNAEIDKYLKRVAGKTEPAASGTPLEPFHLARHKKLLSALKKLGKTHPALVTWLPRLKAPGDFRQADFNEEWALAMVLRALPWVTRSELLRTARRLVQNTPTLSPSARRESLRFHRAALVRRELSLSTFW